MLNLIPEGLIEAGLNVEGLATAINAAHNFAEGAFLSILPPGSDLVSLRSTALAQLNTSSHQTEGYKADFNLAESGAEVEISSTDYLVMDMLASTKYIFLNPFD